MIPKSFILAATFWTLGLSSQQAADWQIELVPNYASQGKYFYIVKREPFYVILTNTSDHDLILWKEWCSFGYFNLSFEFTGQDGRIIKMNKNPLFGWTVNFPDPLTVSPKGHFVIPVIFSPEKGADYNWTSIEKFQGTVLLKAIYTEESIAKTGNEGGDNFDARGWVGRAESTSVTVKVFP